MGIKHKQAFTIVELLVVIVVIGILAAITIVSFSGVSNKAIIASLQSSLGSDARLLKMYNVEYGYYPSSLDSNNCPLAPDSDTRYCLKMSAGTTLSYSGGGQGFTLINTHTSTGISYKITENGTPEATLRYVAISSGNFHSCATGVDTKVYCWGDNGTGKLGNNSSTDSLTPVGMDMSSTFAGLSLKSVSGGFNHSCAIASNDFAYCWGGGTYGELGNSSSTNNLIPVAVTKTGVLNGLTIKTIATGTWFACVIASDNNAYCWGRNNTKQLGDNSASASSNVPVAVYRTGVLSGLTIKSMDSSRGLHMCVVASNNMPYCWGNGTSGQLGNNGIVSMSTPVAVSNSGALQTTVKSITMGVSHTCAIGSDDKAYCWGTNTAGQLGNNSVAQSNIPVAVDMTGALSGLTIKSISAGGDHTCAIASDNNVYCWGDASMGQLGRGTTTDSLVPVAVSRSGVLGSVTAKSIAAGQHYTCILGSDDSVYCWGYNSDGQLGNNSTDQSLIPVAITNI